MIDRFQGSESSTVIFDPTATERLGFSIEPRRLNVDLGRAKHMLYIIGSKSAIETPINARKQDYRLLKAFLGCLSKNGHIFINKHLQRQVDDWNKSYKGGVQSAIEVDT